MSEELASSLVANNFLKPTDVQAQSLVFLNAHVDMVVAAKTGQGKTLCFGIPIMDLLLKRLSKEDGAFTNVKALIMSPTRELAIQIKDHLQAIIPVEHEDKIKLCPLVGGMSIQKQERLLSYNPTVIVATPGRLWELLNERGNSYLTNELPLIDVLVLDEADRMIEDGHFKELKLLLDFIYTKRVEYKKQGLSKYKVAEDSDPTDTKRLYKEHVL
jgi:ATP-dependent RNA helicase DDX24/MAK5